MKGRAFAPFDLHEWHKENDPRARLVIGSSGLPPADVRPYLPQSREEWQEVASLGIEQAMDGVKTELRHAYGFAPEEVLLTQGASEADFVAAFALSGPAAHMVVEEPGYFALLEPARALGVDVTRVMRDARDRFALGVAAVERAITDHTTLVSLARPHNPTGHRITDDDLRSIAETAAAVGAYVLVDEVFAEATSAGDVPARPIHDHILSVNSLTKCMGFGPLHVGWISGPADVIEHLRLAKEHVRPLNPVLNLALAARILAQRERILAATRERRTKTGAIVSGFMESQDALSWVPQDHGTTTVLRLPRGVDDVALARRLLSKDGVLVSPGSFVELPGWVRIGLLGEPTQLEEGLAALGSAVAT